MSLSAKAGQRSFILLILLILSFSGACAPRPVTPLVGAWALADLRSLDAAGALEPGLDLLAAYTRRQDTELQVRLDVLDLPDRANYDLYLAIQTGPGGTTSLPLQAEAAIAWNGLVVIPAQGPIRMLSPASDDTGGWQERSGAAVRVFRDPVLDMLEISLSRAVLPGSLPEGTLQVFITPAGSQTVADELGPLRTSDPPPPPGRVLLAFTTTYPAYTPALALRRWDGAHTGPFGGRHGLYNLLRVARNTATPLALLDLNTPAALSALDYSGGLGLVQRMAADGLLILPQSLPAPLPTWALEKILAEDRQTALAFGLPASASLYLPPGVPLIDAPETISQRIFFAHRRGRSEEITPRPLYRWRERLVIPVPGGAEPEQNDLQASLDGPTLAVRRGLVSAALATGQAATPNTAPVLILGGSLPDSAWGNPQMARATLKYLENRPWVHFLNAADLAVAQPAQPWPDPAALANAEEDALLTGLRQAPANPLGQAAWQAYRALQAPVSPASPELATLRENYTGQVWSLLAAAQWADNPVPQVGCSPNFPAAAAGQCVLASQSFLALVDPDSGLMSAAFARTASGVHQVIAPSSQFITGLSDPSTWDPSQGVRADPAVVAGAFGAAPEAFDVEVGVESLILTSHSGTTRRVFSLQPNGLQVEYHTAAPLIVQVPVAFDPWLRFTPGWGNRFQASELPQGWLWEWKPGARLEISTNAQFSVYPFSASQQFLNSPEDPNQDYPPGHFLPFPLVLVQINGQGTFQISITVLDSPNS